MPTTLELERLVTVFTGDASRLDNELRRAERALQRASAQAAHATGYIAGGLQMIGAVASRTATVIIDIVYALRHVGLEAIQTSARMEALEVSFKALVGGAELGQQAITDLTQFALNSPFITPQVLEAAIELSAFGRQVDELIPDLKMIGDIARGDATRFKEMVYIYGKIIESGRLYQRDINQLAIRGVPVYLELAKMLGLVEQNAKKVPKEVITRIRGMVQTGKIDSGMVEQIFKHITAPGGLFHGQLEGRMHTLLGVFANIREHVFTIMRQVGDTLTVGLNLKPILRQVKEIGGQVVTFFKNMTPEMRETIRVVIAVTAAITTLAGVVAALVFLSGLLFGWVGLVVGLIVSAVAATSRWVVSVGGLSEAWHRAKAAAQSFWETVKPILPLLAVGFLRFSPLFGAFVGRLLGFGMIATVFRTLGPLLLGVVGPLGRIVLLLSLAIRPVAALTMMMRGLAAVGPLLLLLFRPVALLRGLGGLLTGGFSSLLPVLRFIIARLVSLHPITLAIAIVVVLLVKYWKDVKQAAEDFYAFVQPSLRTLWSLVKTIGSDIRSGLVHAWKYVEVGVAAVAEKVSDLWKMLGGGSIDWSKAKEGLADFFLFLEYGWTHARNVGAIALAWIKFGIITFVDEAVKHILTVPVLIIGAFVVAFNVLKKIINDFLPALAKAVGESIKAIFDAIKEGKVPSLEEIAEKVKMGVINVGDRVEEGVRELEKRIGKVTVHKETIGGVEVPFGFKVEGIERALIEARSDLRRAYNETDRGFQEFKKQKMEQFRQEDLEDMFGQMYRTIKANLFSTVDAAADAGKSAGYNYAQSFAAEARAIDGVLFGSAEATARVNTYLSQLRDTAMIERTRTYRPPVPPPEVAPMPREAGRHMVDVLHSIDQHILDQTNLMAANNQRMPPAGLF